MSKLPINDGYANLAAQLGTDRDKAASGGYSLRVYHPEELLTAYRSAWLPRKIVDIPAIDATRAWRSWNAAPEEITVIEGIEKRLRLQKKVRDAMILARLYGGAAIHIGTTEANTELPFDPRREVVRRLTVVSRYMLAGQFTGANLEAEWFGEPDFYAIAGTAKKIHRTRLIKFIGASVPVSAYNNFDGWGDSVLQAAFQAIHQSDGTMANAASMVFEAKVDVIWIPRLMEMIAQPDGERKVRDYLMLAMQLKGVNGALVLDGGDTSQPEKVSGGTQFDTKSLSFGGIDALMDRFLQAVAGAADIPATRLLGQSPAGMNATGESDIRNYYDRIQSHQSLDIEPEMELLDQAIVWEATGNQMGDIHFNWNSLWQMNDSEKADIAAKKAGIIASMQATGLWPDEVLSEAGANAIIESGAVPGLEAAIRDYQGLGEEDLP